MSDKNNQAQIAGSPFEPRQNPPWRVFVMQLSWHNPRERQNLSRESFEKAVAKDTMKKWLRKEYAKGRFGWYVGFVSSASCFSLRCFDATSPLSPWELCVDIYTRTFLAPNWTVFSVLHQCPWWASQIASKEFSQKNTINRNLGPRNRVLTTGFSKSKVENPRKACERFAKGLRKVTVPCSGCSPSICIFYLPREEENLLEGGNIDLLSRYM